MPVTHGVASSSLVRTGKENLETIYLLEEQYQKMIRNKDNGTNGYEESMIEQGKIRLEVLSLIDQIELSPQLKTKQKEKALEKQIKTSSTEYIKESLDALTKREKSLKLQAISWYIIGFVSLVSGIAVAVNNLDIATSSLNNIQATGVVYLIFKSLFMIGLLVAASRYSFNLGKTYMNESLKNADRIHAISFGKFYLQVFGGTIEPDDLKEVFKDWNTNQESPFTKLKSDEFDPKMMDAFLRFLETMKGKGKGQ